MALKIKRAYDPPTSSDGLRILIDRLWPRGVAKNKANIDEWLKELAPSNQLRTWFGHKPERWKEFQKRYTDELKSPGLKDVLQRLRSLSRRKTVTLVFAAKDEEHSNARVLLNVLTKSR